MRELNQLLLNFNFKKSFNDHDYYVSGSNFFAFNLIDNGPNGKKEFLIYMEKIFQEKLILPISLNLNLQHFLSKKVK